MKKQNIFFVIFLCVLFIAAKSNFFTNEFNLQNNLISSINEEKAQNFLLTGYSIYETNKIKINSVYYFLIAFIALVLFILLSFKKENVSLIDEAKNLLKKETLEDAEEKYVKAKDKEKEKEKEKVEELKEEEIEETKVENEVFKKEEEVPEEEIY